MLFGGAVGGGRYEGGSFSALRRVLPWFWRGEERLLMPFLLYERCIEFFVSCYLHTCLNLLVDVSYFIEFSICGVGFG